MKKSVIGFVLGCIVTATITFSAVAIGQDDSGGEVGRYAVAATNEINYNEIYVVVIDTKSGEVVQRHRYSPKKFDRQ